MRGHPAIVKLTFGTLAASDRSTKKQPWPTRSRPSGLAFTLIELIVSIAIAAMVAVLVLSMVPGFLERSKEARAIGNMRQIGQAVVLFSGDHDGYLPVREPGRNWPGLLVDYMDGDPRPLAEPNAKRNFITLGLDPLSETDNYTSYIFNGFDDLNGLRPRISLLERSGGTILLAAQEMHPNNFLMNLRRNDHTRMPDLSRYRDGAYYVFADASVRFIRKTEYGADWWLADKSKQPK